MHRDYLIEDCNPEATDKTIEEFSAHLLEDKAGYQMYDGHLMMRVFGSAIDEITASADMLEREGHVRIYKVLVGSEFQGGSHETPTA